MPTHAQQVLDKLEDACSQVAVLADRVQDELKALKRRVNEFGNQYVSADGYLDDPYSQRLEKVVDDLDNLVDPQLRRSVDYIRDLQNELH